MCNRLFTIFFVLLLIQFSRENLINSKDIYLDHSLTIRNIKQRQINTYWNIPTFQCDPFKLNFTILAEKYNIIQNDNDRFRGRHISILYDPGNFPAILTNGTQTILRNGGVPQEGNITKHLMIFEDVLNRLIPNKLFSGIGIIDFESWRPIFRQNFGKLVDYKALSIAIEKTKHPLWNDIQLTQEATRRFEKAAKNFMAKTLILAKKVRPKATWGYYAYPYCFNTSPNNNRQGCSQEVLAENDRFIRLSKKYKVQKYLKLKKKLKWLFQLEDNFYPSIYLTNSSFSASQNIQMIEGRIEESLRIIKNLNMQKDIILYFWYKYQDTNAFLTKADLFNIFTVVASSEVDGLVIWGSSNDVNTRQKCLELYRYIDDTLGPLLVNNF